MTAMAAAVLAWTCASSHLMSLTSKRAGVRSLARLCVTARCLRLTHSVLSTSEVAGPDYSRLVFALHSQVSIICDCAVHLLHEGPDALCLSCQPLPMRASQHAEQCCSIEMHAAHAGTRSMHAQHGPSVSSFDYGACIEDESCSVIQSYRQHAGDAKRMDTQRAFAKAAVLTAPVALALLASQ